MKKIYIFVVFLAAAAMCFTGCESPEMLDPSDPKASASSFYATFIDGSGEFFAEKEGPYNDGELVTIPVPWFYPEDSNIESNISNMRLYANLPNSVIIEPGLQNADLTRENTYSIVSPNGTRSTVRVTGERRKSGAKSILNFQLSDGTIGLIFEENDMIGLVSGGLDFNGLTAEITLSPHASVSPDPALPQNFNDPVTYTVTAHDGSSRDYVVKVIVPNTIPYGIRPGSEKLLWSRSLTEMGLQGTDHNTVAMASSSRYLFLNTRASDLNYYDRYTGAYAGTLTLPFKGSLDNFCIANDTNENLLITNLRNTAAGTPATQTIYRITDMGAPEKYIETDHVYPTGRKLSIRGHLDQDAIILSTVEVSSKVLYWEVRGGVLQSQEPQVFEADPAVIGWNYVADAITVGTDLSQGIFCTGYGSPKAFGYFNADGSAHTLYDLDGHTVEGAPLTDAGHIIQQLDLTEFNGATYLALADQFWGYNTYGHLFDVTYPSNLGLPARDPSLLIFESDPIWCDNNANNVADVNLRVSGDGLKMVFYILGTNGGVAAYEFDCIDMDNLLDQ
ncbi:MAG: DUF5018 domain-containing protein [Bacteroides sp.]|nr:DUF5018 domain-containing protein [Bacteroides sp.]